MSFADIEKLIKSGQITSSLGVPSTLSNDAIIFNAKKEEILVKQMLDDLQEMSAISSSDIAKKIVNNDIPKCALITGIIFKYKIYVKRNFLINYMNRSYWLCWCFSFGWDFKNSKLFAKYLCFGEFVKFGTSISKAGKCIE